jgi:hypothetical protein
VLATIRRSLDCVSGTSNATDWKRIHLPAECGDAVSNGKAPGNVGPHLFAGGPEAFVIENAVA